MSEEHYEYRAVAVDHGKPDTNTDRTEWSQDHDKIVEDGKCFLDEYIPPYDFVRIERRKCVVTKPETIDKLERMHA